MEALLLDHVPKNKDKSVWCTFPHSFFYFAFIAKSGTGVGFHEIVQSEEGSTEKSLKSTDVV
jgi:hypothetical protein